MTIKMKKSAVAFRWYSAILILFFFSILSSVPAYSPPEACDSDTFECTNNGGFLVYRNPDNDCEFYGCELKCCGEEDKPPRHEGLQCCGLTGQWVTSIGDAKTFYCGGVEATGPYPPPFAKPCPGCTEELRLCPNGRSVAREPKLNCAFPACSNDDQDSCPDDVQICPDGTELVRDENCRFPPCPQVVCSELKRSKCRNSHEAGCRWIVGDDRKCTFEEDAVCEELDRRRNCDGFSQCKWRNKQCGPLCPVPDNNEACILEGEKPVMCGRDRPCRYSNLCSAKSVGFKGGQCNKLCQSKRDCNTKKQICYKEHAKSTSGLCIKREIDVFCGGIAGFQCEIGKRCVEDYDDGCSPPNCADGGGVCVGFGCPKAKKRNDCGTEFNPVVCGDNACTYRNPCLAKSAGFEECRSHCPRPDPRLGCGPFTHPGYRCGDGDCHFGSLCLATSVGFLEEQCEEDKTVDCDLAQCGPPPVCPSGEEIYTPEGECCPQCRECPLTECPYPDPCPNGREPFLHDNECCPRCPDNCSGECPELVCPEGQQAVLPPDRCCEICTDVPNRCDLSTCQELDCQFGEYIPIGECCPDCAPDCTSVQCGDPECAVSQVKYTPEGECCEACMRDCSTVRCAQVIECPNGREPVTPSGQCCPQCPTVNDEPCFKPNCSLVLCAKPACEPNQVIYTPRDQCCPMCIDPVFCRMRCPEPVCDDEKFELVKRPDQCCATCEKKCIARDPCLGIECPQIRCAIGYTSVHDPSNPCCNICVEEP